MLKANHEDSWVSIRTGRGTSEVYVKRGQFIFGRKTAVKELKMRPTTVQDRMQKLVNMQNLVTQSDTHYSVVTVLNYDLYQSTIQEEAAGNPSDNRHPTVTNKNDKNEKNNTGRSKKQTDPRVKEFSDFWGETFQKETGQPYLFSFGKDGNLIKGLLAIHDLPILQDLAKRFFRDEQCRHRGLSIGIFYQEVNRLVGLKYTDPLEQARRELRG